jgi:hypothetical protein
MILMGLFLVHQNEQARSACTAAQMLCDGNKLLASSDIAQLEAEKKSLTQKIGSLHQFVDNRILWTNYIRDIANRLPATIQLTSFQGVSRLDAGGKGPSAETIHLSAEVPLLPRGAVPPDVFKLVATLRKDPLLRKKFPQIELGSIRPSRGGDKNQVIAGFSIACQSTK